MTREEAKTIILKHQFAFVSMPDDVIEAINYLVKEESRKGKWISYHCGAYYECSNCHERNNSRYDKYCKFCGADMREATE